MRWACFWHGMRSDFILLNATLAKNVFDRRQCQEERLKHKQRWAGAICCFVLFIVVCLYLATHMKGAFRVAGHPEIGLLIFTLPGAVASFFSQRREVMKPLFGAMLAAPCCLLLMRFVMRLRAPYGKSWRGCSVRCSGVRSARFAFYLSVVCLNHSTEKIIKPSTRGRKAAIRRTGPDSLSPMQQNRYSRRCVVDRQKSAVRFLRVYLPFVQICFRVMPSARISTY